MGKHLTFSDRVKIEYLIEFDHHMTASKLAKIINKSRGAIYYELKTNTTKVKTKDEYFNKSKSKLSCDIQKQFPFCCNPCPKTNCVHRNKIYNAYDADEKACSILSKSRIDTTDKKKKIKLLDEKISPLIMNGQSIDAALQISAIELSNSTIRRYIEKGYLKARLVDLPYAVRFRVKKEYSYKRTKMNSKLLYNRTYEDYIKFMDENPNAVVAQLDSVCGTNMDKYSLFTLFFKNSKLQFAFKYNRKSIEVNKLLNSLTDYTTSLGLKLFDVLLADNGPEFYKLNELEKNDNGKQVIHVFYCDPYRSYQKAECEKNHGLIRRIIKKGESIDKLSQSEIDYAMSNVNSYIRRSINYESPYTLFSTEYTHKILNQFNIFRIDPQDLRLKPKK